ncbi:MAG TPA: hypothetical protein VE800_05870, partial [Actinomycetota bacterium]|nr:hypothetical protein [Actinomycetota bacterium]
MRRTVKLLALAVSGAMIIGAASALSAFAQDATDEKVSFTVGMVNDAITFNPMFMIETPEYATADMMWETFLGWEQEDFDTTAHLATDWEQSEDGLTWTFEIR